MPVPGCSEETTAQKNVFPRFAWAESLTERFVMRKGFVICPPGGINYDSTTVPVGATFSISQAAEVRGFVGYACAVDPWVCTRGLILGLLQQGDNEMS